MNLEISNSRENRRNWNLRKELYSYARRLFDILFSLIGIILTSPIM